MKAETEHDSLLRNALRTVGPSTFVMVFAVLCFGGWQLLSPHQVQIERRVEKGASRSMLRTPGPSDLLAWKKELSLGEKQVAELIGIAAEEKRSLAPLESEIKEKMDEFERWAKTEGRQSVAELQSAAAPISQLSLRKRELTWMYSQRGLNLLSPSQKILSQKLQEKNNKGFAGGSDRRGAQR